MAIYFIVPSACPCLDLTTVRQLPLGSSRSFSVTQLSTDSLPVLPTVLHAEGDFGIHAVLHLPLTSIPDNYLNVFTLFTVCFYKWICPRKIQPFSTLSLRQSPCKIYDGTRQTEYQIHVLEGRVDKSLHQNYREPSHVCAIMPCTEGLFKAHKFPPGCCPCIYSYTYTLLLHNMLIITII